MKNSITRELAALGAELDRLIKKTRGRLKNVPAGSLNISIKHGQPMYYWYKGETGKKKYLGKEEEFKISRLAQKDFDLKVLRAAEKQKKSIDTFLKNYDEDALKSIYAALPPERKKLIDADVVDDDEYVANWLSVSYEPGKFNYGAAEYYSLKGERVRSKSEKIIADTLYINGIPYRYEFPLRLKDGQTWRPDFRILNIRTREEFILEHFGMMDDPDYCANALGKMHILMDNGYFPGENLLITAESSLKPFNTKDLDMIIKHYLK